MTLEPRTILCALGLVILAVEIADAAETIAKTWAFQPPERPEVPAVRDQSWVRGPIDRFVLERLERENLVPAPEASRLTLIRRLYFGITGLPPEPEAVDAYERDADPTAYERLVDRLLDSPHFGERWARHWLDVARFCESHGFEFDKLRDHAWPYRDYVIDAFNEDKPYNRFVEEQIAGDVLEPVSREGIAATGFLVCGPWDEAGNIQTNLTLRAQAREEELEDIVSVVSQTFLGVTVNCARCHDHKFDPVPQTDYFRLRSILSGVRHGERPLESAREARELERLPRHVDSPTQRVYAGTREQPAPTRRLARGDVTQPQELVAPGGLTAIGEPGAEWSLGPEAPEHERRVQLARWITNPRHPLTARVLVNRLWHHHLGLGLVATPNDFGAAGLRPSHPELLDWLANELVTSGWSLKRLHREILLSATYRQSSAANDQANKIDSEGRLLWRWTPRRLEAEAIRDTLLAASGQLNLALHGPSFRDFEHLAFPAAAYVPVDRDEPSFHRRSIYRMNVQSGKHPLLETFDCPEASVKTPRRGVTITPAQALALLNSPWALRAASHLARRSAREATASEDPLARAWRIVLGRAPTPEEMAAAEPIVRDHGLDTVCWALFNASEFLHVD